MKIIKKGLIFLFLLTFSVNLVNSGGEAFPFEGNYPVALPKTLSESTFLNNVSFSNQTDFWGDHFFTDYDLLVPYTGATQNVDLGFNELNVDTYVFINVPADDNSLTIASSGVGKRNSPYFALRGRGDSGLVDYNFHVNVNSDTDYCLELTDAGGTPQFTSCANGNATVRDDFIVGGFGLFYPKTTAGILKVLSPNGEYLQLSSGDTSYKISTTALSLELVSATGDVYLDKGGDNNRLILRDDDGDDWYIGALGSNGLKFGDQDTGLNYLTIDSSSSNFTNNLNVEGISYLWNGGIIQNLEGNSSRLQFNANNSRWGYFKMVGDTTGSPFIMNTNGRLDFQTDSVTRLFISETGNINIIKNLDVTGNTTSSFFIGDGSLLTNIVGANATTSLNDENINHSKLNNATYFTLEDWFSLTQSPGKLTGGEFIDNGDGTVNVSAGTGIIKDGTLITSNNSFMDWEENSSVTLVDETTNYIYIDYNSGSPNVKTTITQSDINGMTKIGLGQIYREGIVLHMINAGMVISDIPLRILKRFNGVDGDIVRASGFVVAETGERYLTTTSGVIFAGITRLTTTGIDTSGADTFEVYYRDGIGGWVEVESSQINNTFWDDGTGTLNTLTAQRYGVHWAYGDNDGHLMVVYGQGDYTLALAESAQPLSTLPNHVEEFGFLASKIIVQQGQANLFSVASAYDIVFTPTSISDHNELSNLQGGVATEYYHLNSTEHTFFQDFKNSITSIVDGLITFNNDVVFGDNVNITNDLNVGDDIFINDNFYLNGLDGFEISFDSLDYTLTDVQGSVNQRIRFIDGNAGEGGLRFDFSNDSFNTESTAMYINQQNGVNITNGLNVGETITQGTNITTTYNDTDVVWDTGGRKLTIQIS